MRQESDSRLFAPAALLPEGWAEDVVLEIDEAGAFTKVSSGASPAGCKTLEGPVVPGMPNLHSHAFQRAMTGRAERRALAGGSFWEWRDLLYRFALKITPRQLQAIAAQSYLEMLKAGYTSVCEFHYLHHDPAGEPYADPLEMSRRLLTAAKTAGIGQTLLPVFFANGDFGGAPPQDEQRRFVTSPDGYLLLLEEVRPHCAASGARLGMAPHSLRAVTPESLRLVLKEAEAQDAGAPVHMHIAEQVREVERCRGWSGKRPVRWLLDNHKVDSRWCLIHATHMTPEENSGLADRGAVAGLCPSTEGNLGDGFFGAVPFLTEGGQFGIGSDSNVTLDPWEELRWLEYGQRLLHRERCLLAEEGGGSVGASLFRAALEGGARASGRPLGRLEAGYRADLLVLDGENPRLWGLAGDALLDALVFASAPAPLRSVMVGGSWQVERGRHAQEDKVFADYKHAMGALLSNF